MRNTADELAQEMFANMAGDGEARLNLYTDGRRMRPIDWIVIAIYLKAEQGESPWVVTKKSSRGSRVVPKARSATPCASVSAGARCPGSCAAPLTAGGFRTAIS